MARWSRKSSRKISRSPRTKGHHRQKTWCFRSSSWPPWFSPAGIWASAPPPSYLTFSSENPARPVPGRRGERQVGHGRVSRHQAVRSDKNFPTKMLPPIGPHRIYKIRQEGAKAKVSGAALRSPGKPGMGRRPAAEPKAINPYTAPQQRCRPSLFGVPPSCRESSAKHFHDPRFPVLFFCA